MGSTLSHDSSPSLSEDSEESEEEIEELSESTSEDEIRFKHPVSYSDSSAESTDGISLDCTTSDATQMVPPLLTLENVLWIEKELDYYEKVSLVYLLYDNPHFALQELTLLLAGEHKSLILNWAKYEESVSRKWQQKLVEALCVIQNYKILKILGYNKTDANERYLPTHYFTSLSITKSRKVLYTICERLTGKEVEALISSAMADFSAKGLEFKRFNSAYLELSLLYWESVEYINPDSMTNLYSLFKQLEQFEICDMLKRMVSVAQEPTAEATTKERQPQNKMEAGNRKKLERAASHNKTVDHGMNRDARNAIFDKILDDNVPLQELMSTEASSSDNASHSRSVSVSLSPDLGPENLEDRYYIDEENPGTVLIINQEIFYTEPEPQYRKFLTQNKLESRTGTSKDRDDLMATFAGYGFNIILEENLTHLEVEEVITRVVRGVREESSLFVCIMSHGEEGVVYGVNSCRVNVRSIQNIICGKNLSNLLGKPKTLILQSCQGTQCQKVLKEEDDMEVDGPSSKQAVPSTVDMLTFWATVPGFAAIRHKNSGTWFIQSLCQKMRDLGNKCHFEDICTKIVNDVSSKKWNKKTEELAMVPLKVSTLRKHFFLPSMKSQSV